MHEFKDYLKEQIEAKGFSINQLAKFTGKNRVSIDRLLKGSAPSTSTEIIKALADGLKLKGPEREEFFCLAYLSHDSVTPETRKINPESLPELFKNISGKAFRLKKTPKGLSITWVV